MKALKISGFVVLALMLASSAFAANNGSFSVRDSISVNGTQLQPGDYKVAWSGNGSNVEVNIMKGNKVVATTPAHMVDLNSASRDNASVLNTNADGSRSLSQIRFAGKKYALALGSESAQAESK